LLGHILPDVAELFGAELVGWGNDPDVTVRLKEKRFRKSGGSVGFAASGEPEKREIPMSFSSRLIKK